MNIIKKGTAIKFQRRLETEPRIWFVIQHNARDIWIERIRGTGPPYTTTIKITDMIKFYPEEDYPEYYL
ncbi:MAG: hypothetical protein J7L15_05355 [Clostridiales bacterium]|nr:hypothetical protein [Clostridiales bacterium]